MPTKKILCFAPHPDDEMLGCGGSLIKARNKKYKIGICYLTMGENGSPKFSPNTLKKIRREEALTVCKKLGVIKEDIYFMNIPDNQIDANNYKSYLKIISLLRMFRPNTVYLPHENENYHDHKQANRLIQRALDMSGSNNFLKTRETAWWVDNVLAYEISTPLCRYNYAENISEVIDEKISILKLYKSQTLKSGNLSNFIGDNAKALSAYRASMSVGKYREAFQVLRVANIL